ncbi:MAG: hypothetical protein HY865_13085 [Chloroflexi bacterium]|nr:hypothetical protein [Chloroflexota bacterium]
MKFSRNTAGLTLQLFLLLLVVLVVLSPVAPLYEPVPARDQGVYLYVGQQILDSGIPYRDVWDHKGPLVYYINALGLWLTDSVWGVWFLEVVFLFLAAVAGFLAMRTAFDSLTALSTTILWLAAFPDVVDHGNSVEEYSLLFQFAAIWFFLRARNSKGWWNEFLIGVMAALTFSLRPNNVGVHLAIGLILVADLLFQKERLQTFKRIAAAVAGAGVVFFFVAVYFAANHALYDLFDQVFVFNYHYSKLQTFSWEGITKGYDLMPVLVALSLAGVAGALLYLFEAWRRGSMGADIASRSALLALVMIPIQLYLSLLSGRRYMHYYIAWLPVLAMLTGFLIFSIQLWGGKLLRAESHRRTLSLILTIGLILSFGWQPTFGRLPKLKALVKTVWTQKSLPAPNHSSVEQGVYVDYILNHTQPGDYVLIWGNESVYNFLTERESPSRFVYTYAFGVPNYVSPEIANELLLDITRKKPMIIDAARDKNLAALDSDLWKNTPLRDLIAFIEKNYTRVDIVGPDRFWIWVYTGD